MFVSPGRMIWPEEYVSTGSAFDGSTNSANRGADLTGVSDGKAGTWLAFVSVDADGTDFTLYEHSSTKVFIQRDAAANGVDLILRNAASTIIVRRITTNALNVAAGRVALMIAWDLANTTVQVYFGDTAASFSTSTPTTDDTVDYTASDVSIGARTIGSGEKLNGCIREIFFDPTFTDLSVEANRRKYVTADGQPVGLGGDGSHFTGSIPAIYMPDGNPADNRGYSGNFTVAGTLAGC